MSDRFSRLRATEKEVMRLVVQKDRFEWRATTRDLNEDEIIALEEATELLKEARADKAFWQAEFSREQSYLR